MSLWCLSGYFVGGLVFILFFWMCLVVGRKSDEKKAYSQMSESASAAD